MNLLPLKQRRSALLTLVSVLAAAYAAPYLVPDSPDSLVFRDGILPALLLLAAAYPARAAFEKHPARALKYGGFLALVFSFFLGLGSELMVYDGFLPGAGSFIRRLAVPCLMTPLLGALFSYLFAAPARNDAPGGRRLPVPLYFLVFALSYTATLLAFFPGVINYDFEGEIVQYMTGEYLASHPIFHSMLTGVLYQIGTALFGSATGGAATYSVFQLLCLSAMFAWCCGFLQKRVPLWAVLLVAAAMAILPFNGILAISTVKDTLFTGLCAMLCLTLWEIAEDPDAFMARKAALLRVFLICLVMSLLRHNAVFAVLPAVLAVVVLCRGARKKAAAGLYAPAAALCLQAHLVNFFHIRRTQAYIGLVLQRGRGGLLGHFVKALGANAHLAQRGGQVQLFHKEAPGGVNGAARKFHLPQRGVQAPHVHAVFGKLGRRGLA